MAIGMSELATIALLGITCGACSSSGQSTYTEAEQDDAKVPTTGGQASTGGQGAGDAQEESGSGREANASGGQGSTSPPSPLGCDAYCESTVNCFCYNSQGPCQDDCMSECTYSAAVEQGCPKEYAAYIDCTVSIEDVCRTGYFYDAVAEDCEDVIAAFVECDKARQE